MNHLRSVKTPGTFGAQPRGLSVHTLGEDGPGNPASLILTQDPNASTGRLESEAQHSSKLVTGLATAKLPLLLSKTQKETAAHRPVVKAIEEKVFPVK